MYGFCLPEPLTRVIFAHNTSRYKINTIMHHMKRRGLFTAKKRKLHRLGRFKPYLTRSQQRHGWSQNHLSFLKCTGGGPLGGRGIGGASLLLLTKPHNGLPHGSKTLINQISWKEKKLTTPRNCPCTEIVPEVKNVLRSIEIVPVVKKTIVG